MTTNQTSSLFALGYRVRAGHNANELLVRKPDASAVYTANPVTCSCTCPWGTRPDGHARTGKLCKHLVGARSLALAQWSAPAPAGCNEPRYEDAMYDLICRIDRIDAALAGMNAVLAAAAAPAPVAPAVEMSTARWSTGIEMTAQELEDLGRSA